MIFPYAYLTHSVDSNNVNNNFIVFSNLPYKTIQ